MLMEATMDKLNDLEKKTIREFDELWNSGSARMRGEADRVGLDEEASDRLVKTVHAYLAYFMGTASMMPELLKDTYARCSLMLLEDATSISTEVPVMETPEASAKVAEMALKSNDRMSSMLETIGLAPPEKAMLHLHMGVMGVCLHKLMSVLGDAPCELFVKMCREQLEAVIKLHDGASGN